MAYLSGLPDIPPYMQEPDPNQEDSKNAERRTLESELECRWFAITLFPLIAQMHSFLVGANQITQWRSDVFNSQLPTNHIDEALIILKFSEFARLPAKHAVKPKTSHCANSEFRRIPYAKSNQ